MKTNKLREKKLDFSENSDTSDISNNSNIIDSRGSFYVQKLSQKKSFCSVTLPYRCNSYVSQLSKKWISLSVTLVHRHFFYQKWQYSLKNTLIK